MIEWEERKKLYLHDDSYYTTYSGYITPTGDASYLSHPDALKQGAEALIDLTRARSVLECGCAAAPLVYGLHLFDPTIITRGFDISPFVIDHAPEQIKSKLDVVDISEKWPYKDESFELVLSFDVLEHQNDYERIYRSVKETCRVSSCYILLRIPMVKYSVPFDKETTTAQRALVDWLASLNVLPHQVRLSLLDVHPYIEKTRPHFEYLEHPNEHPREFWIECFESCGFIEQNLPEEYYHCPNNFGLHSFNTLFFVRDGYEI